MRVHQRTNIAIRNIKYQEIKQQPDKSQIQIECSHSTRTKRMANQTRDWMPSNIGLRTGVVSNAVNHPQILYFFFFLIGNDSSSNLILKLLKRTLEYIS